MDLPIRCNLCPRKCGANRNIEQGFCGAANTLRIARAGLHFWEEPCISGTKGSGTVFFSGCSLKCCYCQNYQISHENLGKEIGDIRLASIFEELQAKGAHNINLVTPTQYLPWIISALDKAKLNIPIVYNTSGYETSESIEMLKNYVDIWLVDLKYKSSDLSAKYSSAPDYFCVASKAIIQMLSYNNKAIYNENGILQKGVIIRHLALPGCVNDSIDIIHWINENFVNKNFIISLMSQYTPFYHAKQYKNLNRRISSYEYNKVIKAAIDLGLDNGFMQEKSSAKEEYTPLFDFDGV